ncbi:fructose-1,6-bisphosphate aldolase, class II [Candidatus Woesearchaeota archaeon CG_4_10_14_0_2_um_filter_33_13]|nr:MAG: fructose-1,6-bisphosphate aldolase, class II [Candidatus Woesearchaeota archaeon CG_4_10_14_0_2_um_filter_33_13]
MMLANTKTILEKARKGNYAVGHFNINNMEILQGVVQAANNLKAPVIVATSEGAIEYAGINFLHDLVKTASELSKVPVALHLDHGKNFKIIKQCIDLGYSSVMIDASHENFAKNIQLTKKVVEMAHKKGISVEAELGTIGGKEDLVHSKGIIYTDPKKAKEFVQKAGCDFLAVAIGTSHGAYKFKGDAKLKIDILRKIKMETKIPLVLHGASGVPKDVVQLAEKYGARLEGVKGVPDSQIKLAVKNGINKINTDTDLRIAFDAAVRKALKDNPQDFDPRHVLGPARQLITKVVEQRIRTFGSVNKA